jgi:hypothetical protein
VEELRRQAPHGGRDGQPDAGRRCGPGQVTAPDPDLAGRIANLRNLLEHWDEQMPVFFSPLAPGPLKRSAVPFAAQNPGRTPYETIQWGPASGPMLGPNISAAALHDYLNQIEADVVAADASFSDYIASRPPSPWITDTTTGEKWWPATTETP